MDTPDSPTQTPENELDMAALADAEMVHRFWMLDTVDNTTPLPTAVREIHRRNTALQAKFPDPTSLAFKHWYLQQYDAGREPEGTSASNRKQRAAQARRTSPLLRLFLVPVRMLSNTTCRQDVLTSLRRTYAETGARGLLSLIFGH